MTELLSWNDRPELTASILNPALISASIAWCVTRYTTEQEAGMPWEVSFLVPPLVLHRSTRERLPKSRATHLAPWTVANRSTLVGFADRARRFRPHVEEGLRVGLRSGLLEVSDTAHLRASIPDKVRFKGESELREIVSRAAVLGTVLGRAGSSAHIFTMLGVSP
jgi:hypothetical protein